MVTGGGTGIGRAAAIALAAEGYTITVAGRTAATLEQTVKLIADAGGTATYVIADVHEEDAVRHAVQVAAGEEGHLDVAVNSAGVDGGNDSHPFIDYPVETLDLMLATNVRGMFFSMKHELEIMAKQGYGSVVNISSGAGLTGVPGYAGYVASKHAEIGLTKSAALDYADRGVRVNAVCRGLVTTPLIADMVTEKPEIHEPTRRLPSAWPHRRAGGGRRLDRLPGHRHVQLRHRRRTARGRRLSGALIAPPRTPESIKEKT